MFRLAQYLLLAAYAVLPVGMVFLALWQRRRGRVAPLVSIAMSWFGGILIGTFLVLTEAHLTGRSIPLAEGARLIYFVIGALCMLKAASELLLRGFFRLGGVHLDELGRPRAGHARRAVAILLGQRVLLLAIAIPYVASLFMTYRPRSETPGTPSLLGLDYTPVTFSAADGVSLSGWWIPARPSRRAVTEPAEDWARQTVLLCHGVASDKVRQLGLARMLAVRGFNVLAFDFRAHGESGGRFVSYGDRERLDVLAALGYLKEHRTAEAERVFGVGANTGAAALLAAAAEPDGQFLDTLVLYEPYAHFDQIVAANANRFLPRGVRWLVSNLAPPLASLHSGANLGRFAPAEYAPQVWPRPVLVVHGRGGLFVPVAEEMDLYQSLSWPKQQFWPSDNYADARARWIRARDKSNLVLDMLREWLGIHNPIGADPGVQYRTVQFLRSARSSPAI